MRSSHCLSPLFVLLLVRFPLGRTVKAECLFKAVLPCPLVLDTSNGCVGCLLCCSPVVFTLPCF